MNYRICHKNNNNKKLRKLSASEDLTEDLTQLSLANGAFQL